MEMEKAKKRGRPAQLLQRAELHAFVDFLLENNRRTELQNQVIDALEAEDFNFEMLSEAQKILVKEALKPYREHLKLQLLFDELSKNPRQTEYEAKFIELFHAYQDNQLGVAELNILKMMCTRYLNFKAQKLQYADLELYLSQIQKKDAGKKRKAENNRKYQLGGAVIAAYKELGLNIDTLTPDQVRKAIVGNKRIINKIEKSIIFEQIDMDLDTLYFRWPIFLKVIDKLAMIEYEGEVVPEYIKEIYLALSECKAGKKQLKIIRLTEVIFSNKKPDISGFSVIDWIQISIFLNNKKGKFRIIMMMIANLPGVQNIAIKNPGILPGFYSVYAGFKPQKSKDDS